MPGRTTEDAAELEPEVEDLWDDDELDVEDEPVEPCPSCRALVSSRTIALYGECGACAS